MIDITPFVRSMMTQGFTQDEAEVAARMAIDAAERPPVTRYPSQFSGLLGRVVGTVKADCVVEAGGTKLVLVSWAPTKVA